MNIGRCFPPGARRGCLARGVMQTLRSDTTSAAPSLLHIAASKLHEAAQSFAHAARMESSHAHASVRHKAWLGDGLRQEAAPHAFTAHAVPDSSCTPAWLLVRFAIPRKVHVAEDGKGQKATPGKRPGLIHEAAIEQVASPLTKLKGFAALPTGPAAPNRGGETSTDAPTAVSRSSTTPAISSNSNSSACGEPARTTDPLTLRIRMSPCPRFACWSVCDRGHS